MSNAVRTIMAARLDCIKAKGFDAMEPDCIDGWENNTGFPITAQDQLNCNEWFAAQCHARMLSIALKGDNDQVGDLYTCFDYAPNEQCNQYNECFTAPNRYALSINQDKTVFNVDYNSKDMNCAAMDAGHINSMLRDLNFVEPTNNGYVRVPCIADTQTRGSKLSAILAYLTLREILRVAAILNIINGRFSTPATRKILGVV